jgi:hypothetical protein
MPSWLNRGRSTYAVSRALSIALVLAASTAGCKGPVSPEQAAAMTKIQDLGGRTNFKHGGYEIDLTNTGVEDEDLACLKHFPNLKNVDLRGTRVTDKGLVHLQGITTLEFVSLQRSLVSPAAADSLGKQLPKAYVSH